MIGRFRCYGEPVRQDDVQAWWACGQDWRPNTTGGVQRVKYRIKCFNETRSHGPTDQDLDVGVTVQRMNLKILSLGSRTRDSRGRVVKTKRLFTEISGSTARRLNHPRMEKEDRCNLNLNLKILSLGSRTRDSRGRVVKTKRLFTEIPGLTARRLNHPRMEKSHSCWPRTVWCVVNMFHKNGMRPLIIANGTKCYSILYCNSQSLHIRLKYKYSLILAIVDSLPGNTKRQGIDKFVAFGVRLVHSWAVFRLRSHHNVSKCQETLGGIRVIGIHGFLLSR